MSLERRITREVPVGNVTIGGEHPIVVQSMTATKTQDTEATIQLVNALHEAGAGIIRIAADTSQDATALELISAETDANLSVDLQENYRLATQVAPHVQKIRYNPGHLWHHEREKPIKEKVAFLAETAAQHNIALRVGVNHGSVDPEITKRFPDDSIAAVVASAVEHSDMLEELGFYRYVVSIKDSDPHKVIEANRRFAALRPDVPLHLGVTEAGLPIYGIAKSSFGIGTLLQEGIGETLRVSLTLPNKDKADEVLVGKRIIEDAKQGRKFIPLPENKNLISCPSCNRVENEAFVELAQSVDQLLADFADYEIKVAVMGCRVNGPGETDEADLGLWCGIARVVLKRGTKTLGAFPYDEILTRLREEAELLITERYGKSS